MSDSGDDNPGDGLGGNKTEENVIENNLDQQEEM